MLYAEVQGRHKDAVVAVVDMGVQEREREDGVGGRRNSRVACLKTKHLRNPNFGCEIESRLATTTTLTSLYR